MLARNHERIIHHSGLERLWLFQSSEPFSYHAEMVISNGNDHLGIEIFNYDERGRREDDGLPLSFLKLP